MRNFPFFLIALLVLYFFYVSYGSPLNRPIGKYIQEATKTSVCDYPIGYKVGNVDKRFKISKDEFTENIEQASQIWEKAYGKNLFKYDPHADLAINLVFDARQELNNQITSLEGKLGSQEGSIKQTISDYEKKLTAFNSRLEKFNQKVDYWNQRGGAPPDEYDKLIAEQNSIQNEAAELDSIAASLNKTTSAYNGQVDTLNKTINTFKQTLEFKPEEGIYDPQTQTINIYFNVDKNELVHTLAHELGHARGLGHVQDKKAIMHPLTNSRIQAAEDDLKALDYVCQKNYYMEKLRDYFYSYQEAIRGNL